MWSVKSVYVPTVEYSNHDNNYFVLPNIIQSKVWCGICLVWYFREFNVYLLQIERLQSFSVKQKKNILL